MRRGLWAFRVAVTALVGIDLALGAVRVRAELLQLHGATLALNVLLFGSGPLVAGVLALALLWRAEPRAESRLLALFLALLGYFQSSDVVWELASGFRLPPWGVSVIDTFAPAAAIAGVGALLRFSSVFPSVLRPEDLGAPAAERRLLGRIRIALLRPAIAWIATLGALPALLVPGELMTLLQSERHAAHQTSSVVKVVIIAVVLGLLVLALANLWTGYRMFFSGALDPALAIRRTAVFGLVGLTMVFVFAGVENAVQNVVAERLGLSDHISGLVSGGLVAPPS